MKCKDFYIRVLESMLDDPMKHKWHERGWPYFIWLLIQYRDYNIDNNSPTDAMLYKEFIERFKCLDVPRGLDTTNEIKHWFKEIGYYAFN